MNQFENLTPIIITAPKPLEAIIEYKDGKTRRRERRKQERK